MFIWTTLPPHEAAETWEPPDVHRRPPAPAWVTKVRELLSDGSYKLVMSPDGHAFVGTASECETHMLSRDAYLHAQEAAAQARAAKAAEDAGASGTFILADEYDPNSHAPTEETETLIQQ